MIRILQGDCREVMKTLAAASVDAVVTDPPYELGFMGKKWDNTGVANDVAVWRECLRVLKPGGHLLAFSGTRTQHRMVCAIEDAGFEIRDQIGWAYGSGFPKSHNGEWGGTALKPAWEPICMARKPLIGTVASNVLAHGTGGLNIDGCRVALLDGEVVSPVQSDPTNRVGAVSATAFVTQNSVGAMREAQRASIERTNTLGRWPANLIHDGSDDVLAAFPDAPGQQGEVRGTEPSQTGGDGTNCYGKFGRVAFNRRDGEASANSDNDGAVGFKMKPGTRREATSAARFFYCAKADRADRNEGLHGMPTKDLNWSSGTQAPGTFQSPNTNRAAANHHPTVKPTDLMRYLCRLVTPAGGLVLDPFMGSGSTLKAAEIEGFSAIGIELSAEYIEIARRRIGADMPLFAEVDA